MISHSQSSHKFIVFPSSSKIISNEKNKIKTNPLAQQTPNTARWNYNTFIYRQRFFKECKYKIATVRLTAKLEHINLHPNNEFRRLSLLYLFFDFTIAPHTWTVFEIDYCGAIRHIVYVYIAVAVRCGKGIAAESKKGEYTCSNCFRPAKISEKLSKVIYRKRPRWNILHIYVLCILMSRILVNYIKYTKWPQLIEGSEPIGWTNKWNVVHVYQ